MLGSQKKDLTSEQQYWVAYVFSAYQGTTDVDRDGYGEIENLNGHTAASRISTIYQETIRDSYQYNYDGYVEKRQIILAHEIGHQFHLSHFDQGTNLMHTTNWNKYFVPEHKAIIRSNEFPGE